MTRVHVASLLVKWDMATSRRVCRLSPFANANSYPQLTSLTESVNEVLKQQRLSTYYAEPRFHTSIAWWFPDATNDQSLQEKLEKLELDYGADLRKHVLDVDAIYIKIGKEVTSFSLA